MASSPQIAIPGCPSSASGWVARSSRRAPASPGGATTWRSLRLPPNRTATTQQPCAPSPPASKHASKGATLLRKRSSGFPRKAWPQSAWFRRAYWGSSSCSAATWQPTRRGRHSPCRRPRRKQPRKLSRACANDSTEPLPQRSATKPFRRRQSTWTAFAFFARDVTLPGTPTCLHPGRLLCLPLSSPPVFRRRPHGSSLHTLPRGTQAVSGGLHQEDQRNDGQEDNPHHVEQIHIAQ